MKYTDEQYLGFDISEGDRIDIRCRTRKLVKVRADHECCMSGPGENHVIPKGVVALYDKAIVEGEWQTAYICIPCIDKWYDDLHVDTWVG